MQPRDLFRRRRPSDDPEPSPDGSKLPPNTVDPTPSVPASTEPSAAMIRERQRTRRDEARRRQEMSVFLGAPIVAEDEEDDEPDDGDDGDGHEEEAAPPVVGRIWVVFREASWEDATGTLRESDTLVSVFASEQAAKDAVATLDRDVRGDAHHWIQPYIVNE